jgi:hypothetical protein
MEINKREIKQKPKIKIEYFSNCPICNKEIKGTSISQAEYNLKLHLDKHKRKGEKK